MSKIGQIDVTTIDGKTAPLADFLGKATLVVNVASKCGFTPQYQGLEAIYRKYKDKGLQILGFPCDQFGHQEPGDDAEIKSFCTLTYDVTFPMFGKIEVNGDHAHPLYRFLKSEAPGMLGLQAIKWNFTKFLIDKDGAVVERYAPQATPESLEKTIAKMLDA